MKVRLTKGQRPIKLEGGIEDSPTYPQYWDVDEPGLAALKPLIDEGMVEVMKAAPKVRKSAKK